MANTAVISDADAHAADLRRRQARQAAIDSPMDLGHVEVEHDSATWPPSFEATPVDRPGLEETIRLALSEDDFRIRKDTSAKIEQRIRYWDNRIGTGQGITVETAKRAADLVRAEEALTDAQEIPIRTETYTEPDWLEPDRITRVRTEAEMEQWQEQATGSLSEENMRLSFAVIDNHVEAAAESHLGRVCCGNRITFEQPWCPGCGTTHSAAVLARHPADLVELSGSGAFRYHREGARAASLCYVDGDGDTAARMADPEQFAERARETLEARIAYETAAAALGAALDMDRLDVALRDNSPAPAAFPASISFGMPEPCDTFEYQMVLTTEPQDEDEMAAKDLSYGDDVVIEAQVVTVKPDGTNYWSSAGRIDVEWSPTLARLCN